MITRQQKNEILELVDEISVAQNNMDAELVCGHDWETYQEEYNQCVQALNQYLDGITA